MDRALIEAVEAVAARAAELRPKTAWADEVADRRANVVRWRRASSGSRGLASPVPLVARSTVELRGRWVPDDEPADAREDQIGHDATGRPVVHERRDDGYVNHTWRYAGDLIEETDFHGGVAHVTWLLPGGEAAVGAAGDDGCWVQRWHHHGDLVTRVDQATAEEGGWASGSAREADHDPAGEVVRLRPAVEGLDYDHMPRLAAAEVLPALAAALERAGRLVCEKVMWDARLDRPVALRADTTGMAAAVAAGLAGAILAAAQAAQVNEPFCLEVGPGRRRYEEHLLPPTVRLAGREWLERMRASSPHDDLAFRSMRDGVASGGVAELALVDHCDDATLWACRELTTALSGDAPPADAARAALVVEALQTELFQRLERRDLWPGSIPEFLVLVAVARRYRDGDPESGLRLAREVSGDARVDAFLKAAGSRALSRDLDAAQIQDALTDRAALEAVLAGAGLGDHARRLAHDVAEVGLAIEAADPAGPAPGSRLGGAGLLASGVAWPLGAGGRPLSFLAGIDLSEMPPADPGPAWPTSGWLLFFADLGDEDGEDLGLFEPADNAEGSPARVLFVPATEEPQPASARPGAPHALREQRIRFRPVLTLPDGYDAPEILGLDVFEGEAYEALHEQLANAAWPDEAEPEGDEEWEEEGWDEEIAEDDLGDGPTPDSEPGRLRARHWVRGHATGVQGETPEPGTVLLLHIADDEGLGFAFLDAGAIQFRIPVDALAAGDWPAATAEPDSC